MIGISNGVETYSTNAGDIYALHQYKTAITGVGSAGTYCCNSGNIYVHSGTMNTCGVGSTYARRDSIYRDKTYNGCNYGDIIVDGIENCYNLPVAGISNNYSYGCYNAGNIYMAPKSGQYYMYAIGCSSNGGGYNGYKQVNVGNLTVDYDKYSFRRTGGWEYTSVTIQGTGSGPDSENYGILSFIKDHSSTQQDVDLTIAGIGTNGSQMQNCRNYADIFVDGTGEGACLRSVNLYGLGVAYQCLDCINYGDIAFSGNANSLSVYTLTYSGSISSDSAQRCVNLGNVSVKKGSDIASAVRIYDIYSHNYDDSCVHKDNMFGWYAGCAIPEGLQTPEYNALFSQLDSSKEYGTVDFQGSARYITICPYWQYYANRKENHASYIINNGKINVHNAKFTFTSNYNNYDY